MGKIITIDPITRLEGHGKIDILLDDKGNVEKAYLQVPELRAFEKFCEGRLAEEMPALQRRSAVYARQRIILHQPRHWMTCSR